MPDIEKNLAANLRAIEKRILTLARAYGRDPATIQLVAVSKTHDAEAVRRVYDAGARCFGENYLQEALGKMDALKGLDIEWHFIGRIQGNKTRILAEHFNWVHGLDTLAHAQRLSSHRPAALGPLNVCLQVNLSGEASKGGLSPDALPELAQAVAALPGLRLRGLMTLPRPETDLAAQREPFRQLAQLQRQLNGQGLGLDSLSMGMSEDLEAAIAEGATLVRIGTAIFGARYRPVGP
jgi:pyridoxal phosphate enzyme (YggS family)